MDANAEMLAAQGEAVSAITRLVEFADANPQGAAVLLAKLEQACARHRRDVLVRIEVARRLRERR